MNSAASGAHEEALRRKISIVRDKLAELNVNGCRGYSKDDISIALHYYDLDVDCTIRAFLENGAADALAEWNKPTRAGNTSESSSHCKRKKRRNKNAVGEVANGDTAAANDADCSGRSSASVKRDSTASESHGASSREADDPTEDESASVPPDETVDSPVPNVPTPTGACTAIRVRTMLAAANGYARGRPSMARTNASGDRHRWSIPQRPVALATDLGQSDGAPHNASLSVGEHFIHAVLRANVTKQSDADVCDADRSASTSETVDDSERRTVLLDSISRVEQELNHFVLEFERRRAKGIRQLECTAACIDHQFKTAHERLDKRHAALVAQFTSTRVAVEQYLEARTLVADALRERIQQLRTEDLTDVRDAQLQLYAQVETVGNDVRALGSSLSRRIDEAAFSTARFECDDAVLLDVVDHFGRIVPFNAARNDYSTSISLTSASSDDGQPQSRESYEPTETQTTQTKPQTAADVTRQPQGAVGSQNSQPTQQVNPVITTPDLQDERQHKTYPSPIGNQQDDATNCRRADETRRTFEPRRVSESGAPYPTATYLYRRDDGDMRRAMAGRVWLMNSSFDNANRRYAASPSFANAYEYEYGATMVNVNQTAPLQHSYSHPPFVGVEQPNWSGHVYAHQRAVPAFDYPMHQSASPYGHAHPNMYAIPDTRYHHFGATIPHGYAVPGSWQLSYESTRARDRDPRQPPVAVRASRGAISPRFANASNRASHVQLNGINSHTNTTSSSVSKQSNETEHNPEPEPEPAPEPEVKSDPDPDPDPDQELESEEKQCDEGGKSEEVKREKLICDVPRRDSALPSAIDWVYAVEQDEKERRNDTLLDNPFTF